MKIESSNIIMTSKTEHMTAYSSRESLKIGLNNSLQNNNANSTQIPNNNQVNKIDVAVNDMTPKTSHAAKTQKESEYELTYEERQKIMLLEALFTRILGKKFKFIMPKKVDKDVEIPNDKMTEIFGRTNNPNNVPGSSNLVIEYTKEEKYYEKQSMSFSTLGVIKTSDGRQININLELNMSRAFYQESKFSMRIGQAIDPLVINFEGAPKLRDAKFSFDLNNDGFENQISYLGKGSGFLALDINGDGIINNGSELFGTESGNGFADLGKYDMDGNNWIDENDDIFHKLRIWVKDEDGTDRLFALGEKGIGAIYLGNINTDYSMKNEKNEHFGEIRKTGIYLKESGQAGTIQHIDLII